MIDDIKEWALGPVWFLFAMFMGIIGLLFWAVWLEYQLLAQPQQTASLAVAVVTEHNGFTTRHRIFENMDLQGCLAFAESYSILPTDEVDGEYRLVTCLKDHPTGGLTE